MGLFNSKKGQGLGGLLKVIVTGIVFLSFFPFLALTFESASESQTGVTKWLIAGIIFVIIYLFLNFAFKLGEEDNTGVFE